jgi:hypothetical protein
LLIFDHITAAAYNSVWGAGVVQQSGGGYALVELTQEDLKGFLDPSQQIRAEQQMQPNSSIFFWETKQRMEGEDKNVIHCLPVSAVHCPVAAYADFAPEFKHNKDRMTCESWVHKDRVGSYIFVRPRKHWADVFIHAARKAYRENNQDAKSAKRAVPADSPSPTRKTKKRF